MESHAATPNVPPTPIGALAPRRLNTSTQQQQQQQHHHHHQTGREPAGGRWPTHFTLGARVLLLHHDHHHYQARCWTINAEVLHRHQNIPGQGTLPGVSIQQYLLSCPSDLFILSSAHLPAARACGGGRALPLSLSLFLSLSLSFSLFFSLSSSASSPSFLFFFCFVPPSASAIRLLLATGGRPALPLFALDLVSTHIASPLHSPLCSTRRLSLASSAPSFTLVFFPSLFPLHPRINSIWSLDAQHPAPSPSSAAAAYQV